MTTRRSITLLLTLLAVAVATSIGSAGAASTIDVRTEIAGRDAAGADSDRPVVLDPRDRIPVRLTLRNIGNQAEDIRYVRLEGRALGLTFLTYNLGVQAVLKPGEATTVATELDFFDLEDQATGYLGTSLRVYDAERRLLGEQSFVVDVRGKAWSTLGVFAFVVIGIAIFSCTVLVLNTIRRKLPSNRFVRGLQFAIAGAAIGVTLAIGVSVLRIGFADVEQWAPLVFLPTVIAFSLGYVAPGPLQRSIREAREDEALEAVATSALARATGAHDPVARRPPLDPAAVLGGAAPLAKEEAVVSRR